MWSVFSGTIVNVATVAVGSAVGLALGPRVPDRFQRIILICLGLVTITLGVDAAVIEMNKAVRQFGDPAVPTFGARLAMVTVGSLIVGALLGSMLRLHERIDNLGTIIHARLGGAVGDSTGGGDIPADAAGSAARFAEGFLSASVIFCVGPLTMIGCLQNGADGNPALLYIKSCLDGFCSMALAASLGLGVAFSIVTVLVFQGGLALAAYYVAAEIPELSVSLMNVVGGYVLLATSLMILEIKRIPVADLLPGIFLAPVFVWAVERVAPGALLIGG
jgi:hypothetical protein